MVSVRVRYLVLLVFGLVFLFYRSSSSIGTGVIFNSLLFAWTSVGAFPFGSF